MNVLELDSSSNCVQFSNFSFQPLSTEGAIEIRGAKEVISPPTDATPGLFAPLASSSSLAAGERPAELQTSPSRDSHCSLTHAAPKERNLVSSDCKDDRTLLHGSFSDTAGEVSKDHEEELEPDSNSTSTGHGDIVLRVVPRINGNTHFCKVCQKTLSSRMQLKNHIIRQHVNTNEEKPFVCPACQLSFKRIAHLHRHQTVHTGFRTFACTKCNKSFARNDHLTAHLWTHESGPFICASCHREFPSRASLKMHTSTEHPLRRRRKQLSISPLFPSR